MVDAAAAVDHARQTDYSDPGDWAALLDDIDPTIEAVSALARNVVAHYRAQAAELPEFSREDISLRWVARMLDTDQRRNGVPLTVERPVASRLQGCCRDHTLLAVAALRHHGIPARSRVGFATYLSPTCNHDHVIVQAWLDGRWRQFDPEFAGYPPGLIDPTDIPLGPNGSFRTAARVWLAHRAGSIDVNRFGGAGELGLHGDWFVHGYVIAELAHRFGDELLLWDTWGARTSYLETTAPVEVTLVDDIAQLLVRADDRDTAAERQLLARYQDDERLHPGQRVRSFSPNGGLYDVDLRTRIAVPVE